ncbi:hypothetical protein SANA_20450 [Gottschalkiaceae bacterium SANA]|nr:hypothetical protein SANA_20450 [Gottschalkiaceae bacterium SANA]
MKKIILSSSNPHKIGELRSILKGLPIEVISKKEAGFGDLEVIEDGDTLEANAKKKALAMAERSQEIILADDTGLFVDALDGAPGVYSARFAGEDCSYADNNKKLLSALTGIPEAKRGAHFETVIAIVWQDGSVQTVKGRCDGVIGFEAQGDNGFGYDPLFVVSGTKRTFAQMKDEEKNQISHRANALRKLREVFEERL